MQDSSTNKRNRFAARPVLYLFIFLLAAAVVTLIIAEVTLKQKGMKPGYIGVYKNTTPPADLKDLKTFYTDDEGVFKGVSKPGGVKYNSDGFRGIEFRPSSSTEKKKILFIGDSFTWGGSAEPLTNGFVDIVGRSGYVAYNAGIPATDLNQYTYLAEKYVPILKPDVVAIMFFMGNDLNGPIPMAAGENHWYVTNKGWLYAYNRYGDRLSLEEAYAQSLGVFKPRPSRSYGLIQNVFMSTVVGTYIWVELAHVNRERIAAAQKRWRNRNHVEKLLKRIKTASTTGGAEFMLFLLPAHPEERRAKNVGFRANFHRFKGLNPHYPTALVAADYVPLPNGHFNNAGHKKYAGFILKTLKAEGY
ncbi:MAG: SGNH/GDSL hydrolase family protein [Thermodesulfobacteriota bacterium]